MQYIVYILKALHFDRFYIGQTQNIHNRLDFHNSGHVKSTEPFRPWVLFATKICDTRAEAMKLEKNLKTLSPQKDYMIILITKDLQCISSVGPGF